MFERAGARALIASCVGVVENEKTRHLAGGVSMSLKRYAFNLRPGKGVTLQNISLEWPFLHQTRDRG